MVMARLFKKQAPGLRCNGIDPRWTVLLQGASVFFFLICEKWGDEMWWNKEDLCCSEGTRDNMTHFKKENGATVHFLQSI